MTLITFFASKQDADVKSLTMLHEQTLALRYSRFLVAKVQKKWLLFSIFCLSTEVLRFGAGHDCLGLWYVSKKCNYRTHLD